MALDLTEAVVEMAVREKVQLIITHHPFLFRPMKQLRTDWYPGRLIETLIKNDIAVYAAHTNLDITEGGVNDELARRIGLTDLAPLSVTGAERFVKLVVFVPDEHAEDVRIAIAKAGAGAIGNYSDCSFQSDGIGMFLPHEGAQPYIGTVGKLERTREVRIETILPEAIERRVVRAMLRAHPYEEPAYDLYPLKNTGREYGLGRIGILAEEQPLGDFLAHVKEVLGAQAIKYTGATDMPVKKVAVCGGSGADLIVRAAMSGVDLLLTADVKYHDGQRAEENGIAIADAGHYHTEVLVVPVVARRLAEELSRGKKKADVLTAEAVSRDVFSFC